MARRVQKGHGQEQWSELRLAELSEALAKLAPQVSSLVVTSMVLAGVVSTAPASDWSTNVQVNVAKQQGTSDDGTTWPPGGKKTRVRNAANRREGLGKNDEKPRKTMKRR